MNVRVYNKVKSTGYTQEAEGQIRLYQETSKKKKKSLDSSTKKNLGMDDININFSD